MSLRSSSYVKRELLPVMSNAIDSSRESNPSRRICLLSAVPLGHVADLQLLTGINACLGLPVTFFSAL